MTDKEIITEGMEATILSSLYDDDQLHKNKKAICKVYDSRKNLRDIKQQIDKIDRTRQTLLARKNNLARSMLHYLSGVSLSDIDRLVEHAVIRTGHEQLCLRDPDRFVVKLTVERTRALNVLEFERIFSKLFLRCANFVIDGGYSHTFTFTGPADVVKLFDKEDKE